LKFVLKTTTACFSFVITSYDVFVYLMDEWMRCRSAADFI
jgi:hypothetical protein